MSLFVTISRKGRCSACGEQGDVEETRPILQSHLFNTLFPGKYAFSSLQVGALRFADHVTRRGRSFRDKVVSILGCSFWCVRKADLRFKALANYTRVKIPNTRKYARNLPKAAKYEHLL